MSIHSLVILGMILISYSALKWGKLLLYTLLCKIKQLKFSFLVVCHSRRLVLIPRDLEISFLECTYLYTYICQKLSHLYNLEYKSGIMHPNPERVILGGSPCTCIFKKAFGLCRRPSRYTPGPGPGLALPLLYHPP